VRFAARSAVLILAAVGLLSPRGNLSTASPGCSLLQQTPPGAVTHPSLNIVVLDPAHGGTDPGARGVGGTRESELVLSLSLQARAALEKQGFSVIETRQSNDNPSFDDRSALANAQRGAIFVSFHVGSTGMAGTVRAYTLPDSSVALNSRGPLVPWDRAQDAFQPMSRRLAELVQSELALRFKGSPTVAPSANIRQLRTIALPAIAIELSSVSAEDHETLDKMMPGVADAVARAIAAYKPVFDATPLPGTVQ